MYLELPGDGSPELITHRVPLDLRSLGVRTPLIRSGWVGAGL